MSKKDSITEMKQSPAWHDMRHIMQSGEQNLTPEMMNDVIYVACRDLDILKNKMTPELRAIVLGLLAQQVLRTGRESRNSPAEVTGIH